MDIYLLVCVVLFSIGILPMVGLLIVSCIEAHNTSKKLEKTRRKIREIIDNM